MERVIPLLAALALWAAPTSARAIQGCTLRDPDRDVRRLFPESTDYRAHFIAIKDRDPALHAVLGTRLGDTLDPVYEDPSLPYAYYEVLRGAERIGFVFGVNQKGRYGGMQLILATDPAGTVRAFYYQKLSSPARRELSAAAFADQLKGLSLSDFYYHGGYRRLGQARPEDRVAKIQSPVDTDVARDDVRATLRGVMKSLILLDLLWLGDSRGKVFDEVERIVRQHQGAHP